MKRELLKQLFSNRAFTLFLSMRFMLTIALQIQAVVVGWEIYRLTSDPLSLGLIGLAEAIPAISVALYAGHIADKYSRKWILTYSIGVLLTGASAMLAISVNDLNAMFGKIDVVKCFYAIIFITGLARGFYAPTGFAFLSQLVKREQLTQASTLNSSSWQIAAIIGPAMGGFIYAFSGIIGSCVVILVFMLLAFACILQIPHKPVVMHTKEESIGKRLVDGIRFVFKSKVILSALSLDLFSVLFGGAVALLPVFAHEILRVGPGGLGLLRAAPSLGASITMLFLSIRVHPAKPGLLLLYSVAAFGVCMIGFGLSENFYLSLFWLFASGAFDSVSVVVRGNILQLLTPDDMRGRVSAVNTIFIGSSNEIGAFESGVAARLLGIVPSVVFGGCMTLLIVTYTSIRSQSLKTFKYES
jgi:MFS family permease